MISEPIQNVQDQAHAAVEAVKDRDRCRERRNQAIRNARFVGVSVDELMRLTGLGRPTIYAAMKDAHPDPKVQNAAVNELRRIMQDEKRAEEKEGQARAERDCAIVAARAKGIPVTAIADAANLDRTQLYNIFRQQEKD